VVPRTVKLNKTFKHHPLTMAIHCSQSTPTTSPPSYCIKYTAFKTIITSGHNYVWQ
jgi:hypothetical protein